MRKLDKYESWLLIIAIGFLTGYLNNGSKVWDSYQFITYHGSLIIVLSLLRPFVDTLFATLLIWGIIGYKWILIIYNIALLFVSNPTKLNNSYDIVLLLSLYIWLAIIICRFFDKILIALTKAKCLISKFLLWIKR